MANFSLIGYVKSSFRSDGRVRITVGEYVQGKRTADGDIVDERMDMWYVFFPKSSARHLLNFKAGDLVIVKGTIHQALPNSDFVYCVNGESIKHFYTRNMLDELQREKVSKKMLEELEDKPDLSSVDNDFQ